MKILGENGRTYIINLSQYYGNSRSNCSNLHVRLRDFLKENFPAAQILEEVHVPSWNVYLDFYVPLYRLACEADGFQHGEYTPFFHKNKMNFARARGRDNKKRNFCESNNIKLIRFTEEESPEQWKMKLLKIN